MPGRRHVHAVGMASLDDLRVAGDDLDPGGARRGGDRIDLRTQHARVEALLQDERKA